MDFNNEDTKTVSYHRAVSSPMGGTLVLHLDNVQGTYIRYHLGPIWFSHNILTQAQYPLVALVIASAVVPTLTAGLALYLAIFCLSTINCSNPYPRKTT